MASQRLLEELNQAIAEYLNCSGYKDSLKVFRKEAGLGDVGKNYECVLEQKWVCVMRLQKKVKDLEAILAEIGRNNEVGDSYGEWIPKSREKFTLLGHRASISCVKFHPFSKFVVSSSDDCTIRVWDCETGDYERSLKGHKESVQDLAFDSQGKVLASCSADLSIKLWDFGLSFECIRTMHGHDQNVSSVAFLVGDVYILSASRDKTIKKWVVLTGCCVQTYFGHHEWVRMVRVHPLGEIFASCSNDQTVRVWSTEGRESKLELRGHGHTVECVAWAPETAIAAINEGAGNTISRFRGPFLASGGRDRTVRLWDVDNRGYLFNLIGHENWIRGLSFHPGGKYLLSAGDDKTLRVWDLRYKQCVKILSVQHFCTSVDFNDSRPLVVSGSEDQTVKIWECR